MERIIEAADFVKSNLGRPPLVGIILGTGLSGLADAIEAPVPIPYSEIPHFPESTVKSHLGKLIYGNLNGVPVIAMAGRFHYYEGYSMKQVTFPVRVMKLLGIETLVVSNASGGASKNVSAGDIAIIRDHINAFPDNPLRGRNIEEFGPRFPDMVDAYDPGIIDRVKRIASRDNIDLKEVVYVGVAGPNLETRAEFKYFSNIGADVVGMSTVPEVLVARHMNLKVVGFSIVTNEGWRLERKPAALEEVIGVAEKAAPKLEKLVEDLLVDLYEKA